MRTMPAKAKSVTSVPRETGDRARGRVTVLLAAAKTFARLGYDGARIDDIATELGSTKGRVYHYYESKGQILDDLLRYGADVFIKTIEPIATDKAESPAQRIQRMAYEHVLLLVQPERGVQAVSLVTHHIVVERGSSGPKRSRHFRHIADQRDRYQSCWRAVIDQGRRDGVFKVDDLDLTVKAVLGVLNWVSVWYRPTPSDTLLGRQAIARGLASYVLNGLGSRSAY
jgi:AcrR family transcriptional regulator